MKQDVVQRNIYTYEINGWSFDFNRMRATKFYPKPHLNDDDWCINISYHEDKRCIVAGGAQLGALRRTTTSNYGTWDWGIEFSFFVPPEDHYNQMIDDSYHTYLFEKALRS